MPARDDRLCGPVVEELEVEGLTDAALGEKNRDRLPRRNGYPDIFPIVVNIIVNKGFLFFPSAVQNGNGSLGGGRSDLVSFVSS
jgi:hypothetical protein